MTRRRIYRSRKQAPASEAIFIIALIGMAVIGLFLLNANIEQRYLILALCLGVLFLTIAIAVQVALSTAKKKHELARALAISQVISLRGIPFEDYIAEIFRYRGYTVKATPKSYDFGVDLLITKKGQKTAVQIKGYGNSVNQSAVREVVAGNAMRFYRAEKTMVVTNSYFTKSVYELARAHNCELIDREKLAVWIKDFQS